MRTAEICFRRGAEEIELALTLVESIEAILYEPTNGGDPPTEDDLWTLVHINATLRKALKRIAADLKTTSDECHRATDALEGKAGAA